MIAIYSNVARVAHTKDEIIMDFLTQYPGLEASTMVRVVVTHRHAKTLHRILGERIKMATKREVKEQSSPTQE